MPLTYPYYEVRFDDREHFASFQTLEEAKECRSKNNWRFISRWLEIVEHTDEYTIRPI